VLILKKKSVELVSWTEMDHGYEAALGATMKNGYEILTSKVTCLHSDMENIYRKMPTMVKLPFDSPEGL